MNTWISEQGAHGFLPFAVSANCAIWRDVLEALGGWDEWFVYTSEDVDLSWRAQLQGFRFVNADEAVVQYRLRGTLKGYAKQHFRRALSRVQLYVRYRAHGMPRSDTKGALLTWGSLVYRLPWAAVSARWRLIWLRRAVYAWGHLIGSVRWRVLYL
jgi:GT2 family glycosyltransferase